MHPSSYYPTQYFADLAAVQRAARGRRISICSFLPDYPDVSTFSDPAKAIRGLAERRFFASAVFWEVLIDQALYTMLRKEWPFGSERPGPPKLGGLLSTYSTNVHPVFLLIAATFEARSRHEGDALTTALAQIGRECLEGNRPSLESNWPEVGTCMQLSLGPLARPDSIRYYVPHGDDYHLKADFQLVDALCHIAEGILAGFSPAAR